jgi:hypothetical protein
VALFQAAAQVPPDAVGVGEAVAVGDADGLGEPVLDEPTVNGWNATVNAPFA